MATRFPNSYAFFQGVDDQQKYNVTRDKNARDEADAEDRRKKAMQDLLSSQTRDDQNAAIFEANTNARALSAFNAQQLLQSGIAASPVMQAEQDLNLKTRLDNTSREIRNFSLRQDQQERAAALGFKAGDTRLGEVERDLALRELYPNATDPTIRKRIADLLALGVPKDRIAEIAPDLAPFISSTPAAQAVTTLTAPAATVASSYGADRLRAANVLAQDAKTTSAENIARIRATAQVDAVKEKFEPSGATATAAARVLAQIPPVNESTAIAPRPAMPTAELPAMPPAVNPLQTYQETEIIALDQQIKVLEAKAPNFLRASGANTSAWLASDDKKKLEALKIRKRDLLVGGNSRRTELINQIPK